MERGVKLSSAVAVTDHQEESRSAWVITRTANMLPFMGHEQSNQDTIKSSFGSSQGLVDAQDMMTETMGKAPHKTTLDSIKTELKQEHYKVERKTKLIADGLSKADRNKRNTNVRQRAEDITMTVANHGLTPHSRITEKAGDQASLESQLKFRDYHELRHPLSFPEVNKRNKKKK